MTKNHTPPFSDDEIRAHTVGDLAPLTGKILIVDCDPQWPALFASESERVRAALGNRALRIEHTGSTSVAGLAAKPIIDILLVVADSADEPAYAPPLERAGYAIRIREPNWYQHRMFHRRAELDPTVTTAACPTEVNLHVLSDGCPEIDRMIAFRDWLRANPADRDLYAETKRALAQKDWKYTQNYADAKSAVIADFPRALASTNRSA